MTTDFKSSRGRTPEGQPNPIDVHVGKRIQIRRNNLHISQENLGKSLGLTFQQVQKYERGINRIGASRLWDISKVLDVPVNFFYEEMPEEVVNQSPRKIANGLENKDEGTAENADPMLRAESMELIGAYYKINSRKVAKNILKFIKYLSRAQFPD